MRFLHWLVFSLFMVSSVIAQAASPEAQADRRTNTITAEASRKPVDWVSRGNKLMDAKRFREAVMAYEKALVLDEENVNVLVDLGTCYREIGKFDKAVEQFRTALTIDPSFPNAHRNLGIVLIYNLHENEEGAEELNQYLELEPDGPDADAIRQVLLELSDE